MSRISVEIGHNLVGALRKPSRKLTIIVSDFASLGPINIRNGDKI